MAERRILPRVGAVVLTQGRRPEDLGRALQSLLGQQGVALEVVVVGNGWQPHGLPDGVRAVELPENIGIPAGRNAGVDHVAGEYLFFLDDDASLPDTDFLSGAITRLRRSPRIGLLQPRVDDPKGAVAPRRWIPRLRKGDPRRSSAAFSCWEGAVVLPRTVFEAAGRWPAPFFYAHEGVELAWRVWDTGRIAWYAGDLVAHHPVIDPRRHSEHDRLNARNRVWLARRNLPAPLVPLYPAAWLVVQLIRGRGDLRGMSAWLGGFREGWASDPGERDPLRWRTVLRMTLAGRPPVI